MTRIRSLLVLVAAVVVTTGFTPPAFAATGKYVAMGDSYSSGSGAGSYYTDGCRLSKNAYPRVWADANSPSSFQFVACGGATTADVLATQVSALTSDTRLVTISIGGNDTGWGDALLSCLTGSDANCANRNKVVQEFIRDTLPGRLNRVYGQISDRAPNARVVVMGYPHLFGGSSFCLLASRAKRASINESSDRLAATISARAAAFGFDYLDARTSFATHEVCGGGTDWIKGISDDGAFHPNATGQRYGYYKPFETLV